METDNYDWSRFSVRIDINAPLEKLYQAWVTRAGIEHWFLRMSEYRKPDGALRDANEPVEKGDTYKWLWHGYGDDTSEHGEILEANGEVFSFRFGEAGNCTVRFPQENGKQMVKLVQDNIPTTERGKQYYHVGCKTGWTFHFTNFKSILEGGADLRNKDVNLKDVINS